MKVFQKMVQYGLGLLALYVLGSGPAVYWVRAPILRDRSLEAFDRYDRRLSAYFSFYLPIVWLRYESNAAESIFAFYERLFQPRLPSHPTLVKGELFFPMGFYSGVQGDEGQRCLPKSACDARQVVRTSGMLFEKGYVYFLPRSEILVAEGTQEDIDLFETMVSDSYPPGLMRYAVYFY